jgi:menaquinone-dependent protoporphyrinogen IX oxidase
MKGLVVYDSYHGNTKLVAEAIAQELEAQGHEAELRSVRDKYRTPPQGDILFLGSPVRMGSTTRRAKKYVQKLDQAAWKDRPLVVFTTILELPADATPERKESREKYDIAAGRKLAELARAEGLNALENHLWVDVKGMKGPLVDTGIEQTKQFTRETLRSLV